MNYVDILGKQFGDYVVLSRTNNNKAGDVRWLCKCACGQFREVLGKTLRKGQAKSCGTCKPNYNWKGFEISGKYWYGLKHKAKTRNIKFDVTMEQAWKQFCDQRQECMLTGLPLTFAKNYSQAKQNQSASLDRIDSTKDYTIDNIQWVHKTVNRMKHDMPQETFLNFCKLVQDKQENLENAKAKEDGDDYNDNGDNNGN